MDRHSLGHACPLNILDLDEGVKYYCKWFADGDSVNARTESFTTKKNILGMSIYRSKNHEYLFHFRIMG